MMPEIVPVSYLGKSIYTLERCNSTNVPEENTTKRDEETDDNGRP